MGNIDLTAKEIEDTKRRYPKSLAAIEAATRLVLPLARLVVRIGIIRRAAARSVGGRLGAIFRLQRRGKYRRAADLAIEALHHYRHQPPGRFLPGGQDHWWSFMNQAAESLDRCDDLARCDELIEMAKDGVEPRTGFYVARSYLAFARLKFRAKDYDAAIQLAEAAVEADETWAHADYQLGWYYLVLGGGDAMQHLSRAVAKDPQLVFRIAGDPTWHQRPDILQKLKELSAEEIVTARDNPAAGDGDGPTD